MNSLAFVNTLKATTKKLFPNQYHSTLDKLYYSALPIRGIIYQGNQVICPCCHLKTFALSYN